MTNVPKTAEDPLVSLEKARQIRADDRSIEALRTGLIGLDDEDRLLRILARWRLLVLTDA